MSESISSNIKKIFRHKYNGNYYLFNHESLAQEIIELEHNYFVLLNKFNVDSFEEYFIFILEIDLLNKKLINIEDIQDETIRNRIEFYESKK